MALLVTSPGDSLQLCRVQFRKFRAKCCHLENLVVNEAPFYTFSYHGQVLTCSPPSIVRRYLTSLLHPDDTVTYRYMPYGWSVREVLGQLLSFVVAVAFRSSIVIMISHGAGSSSQDQIRCGDHNQTITGTSRSNA